MATSRTSTTRSRLPGNSAHGDGDALVAAYEAVICDLDGVVYRGGAAVPGAAETLQALVGSGVGLVYATNNASREPGDVGAQLAALGAPAEVDRVVTSAEAGAAALVPQLEPGAAVLALGGDGVALALREAGLLPVAPADASSSGQEVAAVLQGFGRALTVEDYEVAARHLSSGCAWVATNDDATLPLEWGSAPGNGAYVDLLVGAVGRRPDVVGKPHAPLYELSLQRLAVAADRTLAVGDRLATDIAGAVSAGLSSAWVLTGVETPSALILSADAPAPTYVISELHELLEPYAAPRPDGDGWVCGQARATFEQGELRTGGTGRAIEVVRASLAAVMVRADAVDRIQLEAAGRGVDEVFASDPDPRTHA